MDERRGLQVSMSAEDGRAPSVKKGRAGEGKDRRRSKEKRDIGFSKAR
jgi:hypothetical protein